MSTRIGIFLPRLSDYGGVERVAWRLSKALAEDGHEVEFVCSRVEGDPPPGVTPVVVGRPGLFRWLKVAWYAWAAERKRRSKKYDLTFGLGEVLNMDILRISGGPQEIFWPLSARAYPKGFGRAWKMFRRRMSPANRISRFIHLRQVRANSLLATVSHLSRDWLVQAYPWLNAEDIRVVYNQPDLTRFHPPSSEERESAREAFELSDSDTAIAFAGTAFARKGLMPTIRAMAQLPDNFRLYVAGGRNPGVFAKEAERLGVSHKVFFMGKVDNMLSLYHAADMSVLPSFYDTCANAIPESLACGLRTVGSASDGSSYFLPERWIVADPENPDEIAEKLLSASREPDPEPFSWPDEVPCGLESYVTLVRQVLDR